MNHRSTEPKHTPFKVVQVFVDNCPDEWHITDGKPWKESTTVAVCDDEDTANKIVKAVNNHEALVDILRRMLKDYKWLAVEEDGSFAENRQEFIEEVDTALTAVAESEATE